MSTMTRDIAAIFVALSALVTTTVVGAEKSEAAPPQNPFAGKILLITCDDGYGAVLEKVEPRTLGTSDFLYGRYPQHDFFGAYAGKKAWLPMIKLQQVVEYDDLEEVLKVYRDEYGNDIKSLHDPKTK